MKISSITRSFRLSSLTMIAALIFYSCSEGNLEVSKPIPEINSESYEDLLKDRLAKQTAKNLAVQVKTRGVKAFLKAESLKKFDGDYNFLIASSLNKPVEIASSSGRTETIPFGEILAGTNSSGRVNSSLLDSISEYYPLMQVALSNIGEGAIENWNTGNSSTLVAYVPSGEIGVTIPAYDAQGQLHNISSEEAPDQVVIVLSQNERVIELPRSEISSSDRISQLACPMMKEVQPVFSTSEKIYLLKEDYYNTLNICSIDDGGTSGVKTAGVSRISGCDRDTNSKKDNLRQMKFNSKNVYRDAKDGWFNNDMEFQVDIFFGRQNGSITKLTKFIVKRQSDLKYTSWSRINTEIVTWSKSIYGDSMLYTWVEDDGGGTSTVSTSFSSKYDDNTTINHSTSYTISKSHCKLGESIVEYCDFTSGDGYGYNTGSITFSVNQ